MSDGDIVGNVLGAVVSIKVVETGMKLIDGEKKKTKKGDILDPAKYRNKKFL